MSDLASRDCIPCRGGVPPLQGEELAQLEAKLANGWKVVEGHHLEKTYKFENFRQALDFTIQLGELAEEVNHHPDICVGWGKVAVTLWTHKIGGLNEADFVWAAKADRRLENSA